MVRTGGLDSPQAQSFLISRFHSHLQVQVEVEVQAQVQVDVEVEVEADMETYRASQALLG